MAQKPQKPSRKPAAAVKKKGASPVSKTVKPAKKGTASKAKPAAAKPAVKKLRLDVIKKELIEAQSSLRRRLGVIAGEDDTSDASNVGDMADAATFLESREIRRELLATEEEHLKLISTALERIDKGTYGQCTGCGGPIEPARIEALPYAPNCIACKRKEERGQGGR